MSIFQNTFEIDEIEVVCNLIEPQAVSQPGLVVALSMRDRSQQRERELYLPLQCYFQLVTENGQTSTIGAGADITDYPKGLSNIAVPRNQSSIFMSGTRLDPVTIDRFSTIARHRGAIQINVRFVGLLLNNVRTLTQRMYGFVPYFQFTIERDAWNTWLARWREAYVPSDLPSTIPEHIAADFSEGSRCLSIDSHRAAVVMLRRCLEEAAIAKGADGNRLLDLLQSLVEKKTLSVADHSLASGVRLFGNYGAHPQDDLLSSVTRDDAELVFQVTRNLLKKMFASK